MKKFTLISLIIIFFLINATSCHRDHFFDSLFDVFLHKFKKSPESSKFDPIRFKEMKTSLFGTTLNRVQLSGLTGMKRREGSLIGDNDLIVKVKVESIRFSLTLTSPAFKLPINGGINYVNCDAKLDYNSSNGSIILVEFSVVQIGNFTIDVSEKQTLNNELGKLLLESVLEGFKPDIKHLVEITSREHLARVISWSKNAQLLMKLARQFYTFRSSAYYAWITPLFIVCVHYIVPYVV